ncbi:hypothetical protein [Cytobacillus firmus]|uniref:hypothetical protein n=1 Tax=Cytobacillus firmus TaxID=1399 RepID=UPI001F548C1E|nr:hypothetical protein [Cytobacillus firmus]
MKEMLVYRYEDVIHAPIDLVFKYLDDDEKIKLWNTMLIENIYDNKENKPAQSLAPSLSLFRNWIKKSSKSIPN